MEPPKGSVKQLRQMQTTLPELKIQYGHGERGWATDIGGGFAIIDNIPYRGPLHYLDVVEVQDDSDGREVPVAGRVVWRAYQLKSTIRYPHNEPDRWYRAIRGACKAEGWAIEGAYAGICMVCHHPDPELQAVLTEAGLDIEKLTISSNQEQEHA